MEMPFLYHEDLKDHYIEVFDLPKNSTRRLIELKLAQLETSSKYRELTADEPERLEGELKAEQQAYDTLLQAIDRTKCERVNREKALLCHIRDCEFYKNKLNQINVNQLESKIKRIKILEHKLSEGAIKYGKLQKELSEFGDMPATNEALKRRIQELRKRRQSLDITFVDNLNEDNKAW